MVYINIIRDAIETRSATIANIEQNSGPGIVIPPPHLNEIINLLYKNSGLVLVIRIVYDIYLHTNILGWNQEYNHET